MATFLDIAMNAQWMALLAAGVAGVGSAAIRRGMSPKRYMLISIFLTPLIGIMKLYYDSSKGGAPVFPASGQNPYSKSAKVILDTASAAFILTLLLANVLR
jgi:hypothetical protein